MLLSQYNESLDHLRAGLRHHLNVYKGNFLGAGHKASNYFPGILPSLRDHLLQRHTEHLPGKKNKKLTRRYKLDFLSLLSSVLLKEVLEMLLKALG